MTAIHFSPGQLMGFKTGVTKCGRRRPVAKLTEDPKEVTCGACIADLRDHDAVVRKHNIPVPLFFPENHDA
jgi:hypothetical protein